MRQHEVQTVTSRRQGRFTLRRGRGRRGWALRRAGGGAAALVLALGVGASPTLAAAATPALSPALRAQASDLYAPVTRYEHSTTPAQRARSGSTALHVGKVIDACDAPYRHRIDLSRSKQEAKLYMLWSHATLLQTYQADVTPVAAQLTKLAASWAALSLRNRAMNEFVHAVAAEFQATLAAPPFDSCAFVKAVAAHHFSYAWAMRSSDGVQAARWWRQISQAGNRTGPFWRYVYPNSGGPEPPNAGAHLFTKRELAVLPNLPGELG
jgi:hypothetical protein